MGLKLPAVVPALKPADIYQGGNYDSPDGRAHCLVGWYRRVFARRDARWGSPPFLAIEEAHARFATKGLPGSGVAWFSDNHPPAVVARAWNWAMRRLGYRRR